MNSITFSNPALYLDSDKDGKIIYDVMFPDSKAILRLETNKDGVVEYAEGVCRHTLTESIIDARAYLESIGARVVMHGLKSE